MKLTPNSFFDNKKFIDINLNDLFSKCRVTDCSRPEKFQDVLNKFYDFTGLNTYGGYGENRKDIFKNSYLNKTKNYYHLGIDINVPAGTPIKCPFACYIVDVLIDKDTDIGWGGRIILGKYSKIGNGVWHYPFLVLAHLNPSSITKKVYVNKGEILGEVGTWPTNGNTFNHLHIQCINGMRNFDGYGNKKDLNNYPNPFEVEF